MRCWCRIATAAPISVPTGAVTSGAAVMNSVTGLSYSSEVQKRMSRLVRMPTRRPSGSQIGTPLILWRPINASASSRVADGGRLIGAEIIPAWARLTRSTSSACC